MSQWSNWFNGNGADAHLNSLNVWMREGKGHQNLIFVQEGEGQGCRSHCERTQCYLSFSCVNS